jgi:hypothetical protein
MSGSLQIYMVGVAQLAEHMPVEHEVAGSFPVAHPTKQGIFCLVEGSKTQEKKKPGSFDFKILIA